MIFLHKPRKLGKEAKFLNFVHVIYMNVFSKYILNWETGDAFPSLRLPIITKVVGYYTEGLVQPYKNLKKGWERKRKI